MHCGKYFKGLSLTLELAEYALNMHCIYVTMATENGDIGILKISFLEFNGQSVVDSNTKIGMSK